MQRISEVDLKLMSEALCEAQKAFELGEVPVGAVIAVGPEVVARAHNMRETTHDPTAHAEILAIRQAASEMGTWRLSSVTMYVTLEPCPMCAGALVQARVGRLVYGAYDPKSGAAGTLLDIPRDMRLNHWVEVTGGVLKEECGLLLESFFSARR